MSTACRPYGLVVALVCAQALDAHANERFALVIGNSKYQAAPALRNPGNDAQAVADALRQLDFNVTIKSDLNLESLESAILDFEKSLTRGCVALFYFAGHGMQVDGENYLIPVDANIRAKAQVRARCVSAGRVLEGLDDARSRLIVVVLDCCRDNPFTRNWARGGSGHERGLAPMAIPEGTIIAFSTAPGNLARDGEGANSPYTGALCDALNARPDEGLELREVFFTASREVKRLTGQVPWINMEASLEPFYLWRKPHVVARPAIPDVPPPLLINRPAPPKDPLTLRLEKSLRGKLVQVTATKPDRLGRWFNWQNLTAKYVLIAFYSHSCVPCRAEISTIHEAYQAYPDRNQFDVVGMDLDADDMTRDALRRELGIQWENLYTTPPPADSVLAPYFDLTKEPRSMLVRIHNRGQKGEVVEVSASGEQLMPVLSKYLGPPRRAIP